MSDYAHAFFHKDGVFVAIGGNNLLVGDFLLDANKGSHDIKSFKVGQPPTRAALEKILAELEKAGVKGFFNSIVSSQILPREYGVYGEDVKMLFVQAGPELLQESKRSWQHHIGWYGFFRAENPDVLLRVPQLVYDELRA